MQPDKNFFVNENGGVKDNFSLREMIENSGEGESVLWEGKPDKRAFLVERVMSMFPIALIWLIFDGAFITIMCVFVRNIPLPAIIFMVVFFIIHLTPVWIWIAGCVTAWRKLKNTDYAFTEKRVAIKTGFFAQVKNIQYSEITSVNLKVGFFDRMFKVGDIVLTTSGKEKIMLEDLKDPYFICERLQKITTDIKTDMSFPNDLRPKENHGYNTTYNG